MSVYDTRMSKQSEENQQIYYAWVDDCRRNELSDIDTYMSTVTSFFELKIYDSILKVKLEDIRAYLYESNRFKPGHIVNKINHLKNFLKFIERSYNVEWNFIAEHLVTLAPAKEIVQASKSKPTPISFKDLCLLYRKFSDLIDTDVKWLQSYVIFRLAFDYAMDKKIISKFSYETYNTLTGEFNYGKIKKKLDSELVQILSKELIIGYYSEDSIYEKLKLAGELIGRNVTQEDIDATRKLFTINCPICGKQINNKIGLLGAAKVNILSLDGFIICRKCLEEYNND